MKPLRGKESKAALSEVLRKTQKISSFVAQGTRMKVSELFPSKYLCPADLQGHAIRVTISAVERVKMKDPQTKQDNLKAVLHFEGKQKGLVLNKTNAFAIADILGDDETDNWVGGQITLYTTQITIGGKKKDCIRIRK